MNPKISRRRLLGTAALAAAPTILPSGFLFGADAPSNQITVGAIGIGGRGGSLLRTLLTAEGARVVAVCDVDRAHNFNNRKGADAPFDRGREPAKAKVDAKYGNSDCAALSDFRELCSRDDIDAVVVATPDHWHALATLEAIRAGKHVYCEKPITHLFAEGQALYRAAAAKGIIFQTGSQQRSDVRFHRAVEIVQNGLLGKISRIEVGLPAGKTQPEGDSSITSAPQHQDYEMWTGPSRMLPFSGARNHWSWRWHTAYGGGQLMDWIGHHHDIAHWSMDLDKSGPISVQATNDWEMFSGRPADFYDTPVHYSVTSQYASGTEVNISTKNRMGITWYGEDDQTLYVTRGQIESSTPEWLAEFFDRGPIKPYQSRSHNDNWLEGIRTGKECICPAETGHRSITPGHLGWLSHYMGGKKFDWDAVTETITNDAAADTQLKRLDYRGDWSLGV